MNGINQTVFAYGQTSSGKTHTMKGWFKTDTDKDRTGIIPLSVMEIFDIALNKHAQSQEKQKRQYDISVSYIEIYNECVNDLIDPSNKNLEVRESITNGIYINRLCEKKVTSCDEALNFMNKGDEFRNIAATKLNELSSRSHTVFRINICSQELVAAGEGAEGGGLRGKMKISQLNLVDLAGSEGASKTQAEGIRLREGQNINRSLLALSNVINRLSQQGSGGGSSKQFINYRDSKLTRILQPALGGNSQTAIICTMTQTFQNHQETLNTLLFGQKAKNVKTTVNVNEIQLRNGQSNAELQAELDRANKKICELEAKVKMLQADASP